MSACSVTASGRWSVEKAALWQKNVGWKAGSNFVPSTAVNELEMFQSATYDAATIDRELQYAQDMGFNAMRVFLHNLLWSQDSAGFISTLENFLSMTEKHGISVMFVLFDSCWKAYPQVGEQPEPTPGVHNSQWVQAPGFETIIDQSKFDLLEEYTKGVVSHFKDDSRILAWDVWNEPNNSGYTDDTISPLLQQVFGWIREIDPSQPLTTPIWQDVEKGNYTAFQKVQLDNSDVLSFHSYSTAAVLSECISELKAYAPHRPIICTEYMARTANSTFEPHLAVMQEAGVHAINWGLVTGRTQTMYGWETCTEPATEEPAVWFHDILRADGTPFNQSEVTYIQSVMAQSQRVKL